MTKTREQKIFILLEREIIKYAPPETGYSGRRLKIVNFIHKELNRLYPYLRWYGHIPEDMDRRETTFIRIYMLEYIRNHREEIELEML